jgi:hypothetical protein
MKRAGVFRAKDGSGLGGVTIFFSSPDLPEGRTTISRADGSFEFDDLPDGQYQGRATGPGAAGGVVTWADEEEERALNELSGALTDLNRELSEKAERFNTDPNSGLPLLEDCLWRSISKKEELHRVLDSITDSRELSGDEKAKFKLIHGYLDQLTAGQVELHATLEKFKTLQTQLKAAQTMQLEDRFKEEHDRLVTEERERLVGEATASHQQTSGAVTTFARVLGFAGALLAGWNLQGELNRRK